MSKYDPLWKYIKNNEPEVLSFDEIKEILGFPIDHSFLKAKKEFNEYGYMVKKISMKEETVKFEKIE